MSSSEVICSWFHSL